MFSKCVQVLPILPYWIIYKVSIQAVNEYLIDNGFFSVSINNSSKLFQKEKKRLSLQNHWYNKHMDVIMLLKLIIIIYYFLDNYL